MGRKGDLSWHAGDAPLSFAERAALVMSSVLGADWRALRPPADGSLLVAPVDDAPLRLVLGRVEVPAAAFPSRNLVPPQRPLRLEVSKERRAVLRGSCELIRRHPGESSVEVAARFGPAGSDLGLSGGWKPLAAPGWSEVTDVPVLCPRDKRRLRWWTWSHAGAIRTRHRHVIQCPSCGDASARDLGAVLDAAARLHAELSMHGNETFSVYVVEVVHPQRPGLYVGETGLSIVDRVAQHRSGLAQKAARVFQAGGVVGATRLDLIPPLPQLTTRPQSEAAEDLVHRWLALYSGMRIYP